MDILKEIFGTSDELQISKSLFESEDGHDHQPLSISLEHGESSHEPTTEPLPLLPTDSRPPLLRSQSLDDIHTASTSAPPPSTEEKDLLVGVCRNDSFRPHSAFPHLSDKAGTTPVDLHTVPHEMPMYLLQEDEGNDEEIMQLLGTAESGRAIRGASADRNDVMMRSLRASRWSESRLSHTAPEAPMDHIHQLERSVKTLEMAVNCDSIEKLIVETVKLLPDELSQQVCGDITAQKIDSLNDSHPTNIEVSNFVTIDSDSIELDSSSESHQEAVQNSGQEVLGPFRVSESMLSSVITSPKQSQTLSDDSSASNRGGGVLSKNLPKVSFEVEHGRSSNLVTAVPSSTVASHLYVEDAFSKVARQPPQMQASPASVKGRISGHATTMSSSSFEKSATLMVNEGTQTSSAIIAQAKNVSGANSNTVCSTAIVSPPVYSNALQNTHRGVTIPPLNLSTDVLQALNEILQSAPMQTAAEDIQQLIDRSSDTTNSYTSAISNISAQPNTSVMPSSVSTSLIDPARQRIPLHSQSSTTRPISSAFLSAVHNESSLGEAAQQKVSRSPPNAVELISVQVPASSPSSSIARSVTSQSSITLVDECSQQLHVKESQQHKTSRHDCNTSSQVNESRTVHQRNVISPCCSSKSTDDSSNSVNTDKNTHHHAEAIESRSGSSETNSRRPESKQHYSHTTSDQLQDDIEDMEARSGEPSKKPPRANPLDLLMQDSFEVCVQWHGRKVGAGGNFMGLSATPVQILPCSSQGNKDTPAPFAGDIHKDPRTRTRKKSPSKRTGKRRHGGGWPKGKKRKIVEVDTKPPKPPSTGYGLFLSEKRSEVQNSGMPISSVSKLLGQMWSQLSKEEKQSFYNKAEKDRQRYLIQLKHFLRESHKVASETEQEKLDDFLEQSFANEADSKLLVCDTCGLVFASLANKRTHYSGKLHMDAILKQMSSISVRQEATSRSQTPQPLAAIDGSGTKSSSLVSQNEHEKYSSLVSQNGHKKSSSIVLQNESAGYDVNSITDMEVEDFAAVDSKCSDANMMHGDDVRLSQHKNHETCVAHQTTIDTGNKHSACANKCIEVSAEELDARLCGSSSSSESRQEGSGMIHPERTPSFSMLETAPNEETFCPHKQVETDCNFVHTKTSTGLDSVYGPTFSCRDVHSRFVCDPSTGCHTTQADTQTDTDKQLSEKFQSLASSYLKLSESRKRHKSLLVCYAEFQQQLTELEQVMSDQKDVFSELVGLCSHTQESLSQLQLAVLSFVKKR